MSKLHMLTAAVAVACGSLVLSGCGDKQKEAKEQAPLVKIDPNPFPSSYKAIQSGPVLDPECDHS